MGRSVCDMMTGAGKARGWKIEHGRPFDIGGGVDRYYLPPLFTTSQVALQAGGAAMNTLLQHVAARCPKALQEEGGFGFFRVGDQCKMLVRMASNGQNDAFVALMKAGVGAQRCFRSHHPVNAAALFSHDLLLRLLKGGDMEGKLGIESISEELPPEFDVGGRSLVSNVCLNEKNDHPHAEKILKTVLERFDDEKLAANGRDVETGQTRLHDACRVGNLAAVRALLETGATADVVDVFGRTPLFFVADGSKCGRTVERRARCLEIAELLLRNVSTPGSFVNMAVNETGWEHGRTALHNAVASANVEVVQLLVEKNADSSVKDAAGLTPLDYCAEKCRQSEFSSKGAACDRIAAILKQN